MSRPEATMVAFHFHGDQLDVIPPHDDVREVHVGIPALCAVFGVDFSTQLRKLRSDPAVGVVMMSTPSAGGIEETACIPLRALPLWLAAIHPSKIRPELREKLIRYRREATDILADHFLGPRRPVQGSLPPRAQLPSLIALAAADGDFELAEHLARTASVLQRVRRPADPVPDPAESTVREFIEVRLEVLPGRRDAFMTSKRLRKLFEAWAGDRGDSGEVSWNVVARVMRACGCASGAHRIGSSIHRGWFCVRERAEPRQPAEDSSRSPPSELTPRRPRRGAATRHGRDA
jgi:hypothetical protein